MLASCTVCRRPLARPYRVVVCRSHAVCFKSCSAPSVLLMRLLCWPRMLLFNKIALLATHAAEWVEAATRCMLLAWHRTWSRKSETAPVLSLRRCACRRRLFNRLLGAKRQNLLGEPLLSWVSRDTATLRRPRSCAARYTPSQSCCGRPPVIGDVRHTGCAH